jgi:hypothetical protein
MLFLKLKNDLWFSFFISLFIIISCSDSNTEKKEPISKDDLPNIIFNSAKYKVDLLCLKYNISSEPFAVDMTNYFTDQNPLSAASELDQDKLDNLLNSILNKKLDKEPLLLISQKHGVQLDVIAKILYDYKVWAAAEDCINP